MSGRIRVAFTLIALAGLLVVPALLLGGFNGVSAAGTAAAIVAGVLILAELFGPWVGPAPADDPPSRLDLLEREGHR